MPEHHKELNRQHFGTRAEEYIKSIGHAKGPSLARLLELTKPQNHWIVLDVSTGGGHTALTFSPYAHRIVATDLTPQMLAAAKKFTWDQGAANIEFKIADAENLPFMDREFDLVTNRIALHHYPKAQQAFFEMARVLKMGGYLALVDNIVPPDKQTATYINDFEKFRDPAHHTCYSLEQLKKYITDTGLKIIHTESFKKDRDLDGWADRVGCTVATKNKLRILLQKAPDAARAFLNPHTKDKRDYFSLEEAILIAKK